MAPTSKMYKVSAIWEATFRTTAAVGKTYSTGYRKRSKRLEPLTKSGVHPTSHNALRYTCAGFTTRLVKNIVTHHQPNKKHKTSQKKRKRDIILGTWNVRTLLRAGALQETIKQMEKYNVDVLAVQEVRWQGCGEIECNGTKFRFSGIAERSGRSGTGFLLNKRVEKSFLGFRPINDRICVISLKGMFSKFTLINAYAPTEDADDIAKETFYTDLDEALSKIPSHNTKILLGDFNAKIGREQYISNVAGLHSLHTVSSDNGKRLCQLATGSGMYISSTHFPHKNIHKGTWQLPGSTTANQIDHVLIDHIKKSFILDVRSCRSANVDSDHFLVKATVRQSLKGVRRNYGSRRKKWDVDKLHDSETVQQYEQRVNESLRHITNYTNINEHWKVFANSITKAAEETVGVKRNRRRNNWFDNDCAVAVEAKNVAREQIKKKEAVNREILDINRDFADRNAKGFFHNIKHQTKGFQARINMCKDKDGELLVEKEGIIKRWQEHFQELFNIGSESNNLSLTDLATSTEQEPEPSLEEFTEAIKQMKNGKSPGEDSISAELIKHCGESAKIELFTLIKRVWAEERLPEAWLTGVVVPLHKKGDKLDCNNYRGITLLSSCYKIFTCILNKRLKNAAEEILGEYQGGFRPNRSTTDQIFLLKQNLEMSYEFNAVVHILFIDFKQAFDSID
ncbi:uncharacterized protein LOC119666559 [Teleopsis dalmanni]|uniref:uncharacterized protein LOC119666559 n=1 Tax=Teleopsis dalmanni TaxID=139649 RepID=UPI0018CE7155|nr:uncharacterized protein LOC119666559 [Teleopsis dalmanni]